jgi:hypothetical protein
VPRSKRLPRRPHARPPFSLKDAAYRRWFSQRTTPQIQLPVVVAEKGGAHANANPGANTDVYPDVYRERASKFERRLQAGSWCAMVVLMLLTIYFLMRETS